MEHTVTKKTLKNGTPILVIDLRKLGEAVICGAIIVAPHYYHQSFFKEGKEYASNYD